MTKTWLTLLMLAAALIMGGATPTLAADATGEWARPGGSSKIRISACGSALCGKLIWLKSPRNDTANPDPAKRTRPLLGVQIVRSMKPTGKTNQWKGKVYNAEDGKTYTGFIQMPSANRMKLEGCVMGGLICKGETWTRIK
ncbi:DUF2147 domain-containing protein [Roseibium polysiphoniae]|uniref:DUF2147 domain-containing protein n=1 Tax=Roseibium polysiphoniae TaxID=2571221 RepID=A0A944GSW0_9HYPH|nr:DUF2147 domain-containing protein [Roseibium polysiphoniae]MBS8259885.1 DUF2147 domain-containing protein [Roseibium polysiphoniae]